MRYTQSQPMGCTVLPRLPVQLPPAGSLGRWSQATSGLSLQEPGLHYMKLPAHPVTKSNLTLLTTQQANKLGDEMSRQGIVTLFGKPGIREGGRLMS